MSDELREELTEYWGQRVGAESMRLYAPGALELLPEEFEAERYRRSIAAFEAFYACLRGEIPKAAALTKIDQLSDHLRHGLRQGLAMLGWTEEVLSWFYSQRVEWGRFVGLWDAHHQRIRAGEEEAKEEWLLISRRKCDWARRESGAAAGTLL